MINRKLFGLTIGSLLTLFLWISIILVVLFLFFGAVNDNSYREGYSKISFKKIVKAIKKTANDYASNLTEASSETCKTYQKVGQSCSSGSTACSSSCDYALNCFESVCIPVG